jgi:hypothetical protein
MESTMPLTAIASLRLGEADFSQLGAQGFVCAERRGTRVIYKLRFRDADRRQIVRFIGNADRAQEVLHELKALQADRDARREIEELRRSASQVLRKAKADLEPLLLERGYHYHGQAIRQRRTTKH